MLVSVRSGGSFASWSHSFWVALVPFLRELLQPTLSSPHLRRLSWFESACMRTLPALSSLICSSPSVFAHRSLHSRTGRMVFILWKQRLISINIIKIRHLMGSQGRFQSLNEAEDLNKIKLTFVSSKSSAFMAALNSDLKLHK
jgi:hypothetical protein